MLDFFMNLKYPNNHLTLFHFDYNSPQNKIVKKATKYFGSYKKKTYATSSWLLKKDMISKNDPWGEGF